MDTLIQSKKPKQIQAEEQIIQRGYVQQNQFLVQNGFIRPKRNLKMLLKFNGDQDLALQKLQKKNQGKGQDTQKLINELGYENQMKILGQQGHIKVKKNLKLLIKFNGDFLKALEKLQKNNKKGKKQAKANFEVQQQQLQEMGFFNQKLNMKALKKNGGDVNLASQQLFGQADKHKKGKAGNLYADPETQEKLRQIEASGFTKTKKNLKLLTENDGDVNMVIKIQKDKQISKEKRAENKQMNQVIQNQFMFENFDHPKLENIKFIYLDGNNFLFCNDEIRKMVLSKQGKQAEQTLTMMILQFFQNLKRFNYVHLIYDQTKQLQSGNYDDLEFRVTSARPYSASSDDQLVEIANNHNALEKCLFVTSDRELVRRLHAVGVRSFMKSKHFVKMLLPLQAEKMEIEQ